MTFLATTRIAILRGSTVSDLGDDIESNADASIVAGLSDIPASLIEKSKTVWDPASNTRRTIRVVICRVPVAIGHPATGVSTLVVVLEGDRIKDNNTGRIYAFAESVAVPRALSGQSSLTLNLEANATA